MKEEIIKREAFATTEWAGGETTQLAIYPKDADLAKKDFLWRISSATFTSTQSKFSDFSGYQRYILPLEGTLSLFHEGLYKRELDKYEVEYFDGSWETFSNNSWDCRDYNFIVGNGNSAKLQILQNGDERIFAGSKTVTIFSTDDFALDFGKVGGKREIEGFSLYIIEMHGEVEIRITRAASPLVVTEFSAKQ